MIFAYDKSVNPLTVELNSIGQGGLGLLEIWVKDAGEATFTLYGSCMGKDGTWREIAIIKLPYKDKGERHEGYMNAYPFIKVVNDSFTESEIEIVAGET